MAGLPTEPLSATEGLAESRETFGWRFRRGRETLAERGFLIGFNFDHVDNMCHAGTSTWNGTSLLIGRNRSSARRLMPITFKFSGSSV